MKVRSILKLAVFVMTLVSVPFAQAKETGQSALPTQDQSAIISGSAASTSTYPWMVFLASDGAQFCGASLISPTWVLTAAHCFLNDAEDAVDIQTGAMANVVLNSDNSVTYATDAINASIGQILVHPNYNPNVNTSENKDDFDIALDE